MTRIGPMVVCCVLTAGVLLAQSAGNKPAGDPVSGTWTGLLMEEGATDGRPVTLELTFDGKRAVTGTITGFQNPGDVKTGTFDSKKGTLKLQLGKTGEAAVLLVLEGTVLKDTATGKFSGEGGGTFKLTRKKS